MAILKIIGGYLKGHSLKIPSFKTIRPTTSKLRKAIFDILGPSIEHAIFLDLFSGTGAIGIEALSRGAKKVYFVEKDRKAAKFIIDNLRQYHLETFAEVWPTDALSSLKKLAKKVQFTHIFIDAPYAVYTEKNPYFLTLLHFLEKSELLSPQGILLIEDQGKIDYQRLCKELTLVNSRKFGGTFLHKFTR